MQSVWISLIRMIWCPEGNAWTEQSSKLHLSSMKNLHFCNIEAIWPQTLNGENNCNKHERGLFICCIALSVKNLICERHSMMIAHDVNASAKSSLSQNKRHWATDVIDFVCAAFSFCNSFTPRVQKVGDLWFMAIQHFFCVSLHLTHFNPLPWQCSWQIFHHFVHLFFF